MRILLFESDPLLADLIGKRLQNDAFDVDVAADASEAKRWGDVRTYELLILDLGVPPDGRTEMLRSIRAAKPDILIMALSASAHTDDRVRCMEAGADDFLMKPVTKESLEEKLQILGVV